MVDKDTDRRLRWLEEKVAELLKAQEPDLARTAQVPVFGGLNIVNTFAGEQQQ